MRMSKLGSRTTGHFAQLLGALLLVMTATQVTGQTYLVDNSAAPCLRLRQEASTDSGQLDCLAVGSDVTVERSLPYWREIVTSSLQRGWVAKKFLRLKEPVDPASPATLIPPNAFLEIHFIDVGQGDAVWIHTHDDGIDGNGRFEGFNVVIDGGPYSADQDNPLLSYLEQIGHHGANVDALIVSHPHTDHFRGAETISRHFNVQHYYDPGYPSTLVSYGSFIQAMRGTAAQPGRAKHVHLGFNQFGPLDWGSELEVEVLYAWPGASRDLGRGNTEVNNSSIVLRIKYGDHQFLFMGDAEGKDRGDDPQAAKYVEARLLEGSLNKLKSTVLKIAHHGSETSNTLPFINAVDPQIVVVQSGRKSFGGTFLPDAATLNRYCVHNPQIRIYRTDQDDESAEGERGAVDGDHILIRSNGRGIVTVATTPDEGVPAFYPCP
jgi:beta-lactamase superfamily II metal-dependent hydrolase